MIARRFRAGRPRERGQILSLFVICSVAVTGVVGLVIDGGSTFAQRRVQQNVVDMAALAGANAYLNAPGDATLKSAAAETAARMTAAANGFVDGMEGVLLDVDVTGTATLGQLSVGVTKPHQNSFVRILGFAAWDVSVDAGSQSARRPNAAKGVLPLLFNVAAFEDHELCDTSSGDCADKVITFQLPGTGTQDVPQDSTTFNWTVFCTANGQECNGNADDVGDLIRGHGSAVLIDVNNTDIGPLNAGSDTSLFNELSQESLNETFPVPIVDDAGVMLGIAYFRLVAIEGGSEKVIKGYFVSPFDGVELEYVPGEPDAAIDTGAYIAAELTD